MTHILVTGGTGGLGRELVSQLKQAGHRVRLMSRRARLVNDPQDVEWAQADIETGAGVDDAVRGVEVIIHAATSPFKREQQVDVDGTGRLAAAAREAKMPHFIHVSIVGIERIPFSYYRAKVAGEKAVREGGVPYTILRATQFHSLLDGFLQPIKKFPLAFIPTEYKYQLLDTGEAAARLCALVNQAPAGLLPDMGGPEVLTLGEIAQAWFAAQNKRCKLFRLPAFGGFGSALRQGYNTCPDHRDGKITWKEWLKRKYTQ